jgi:hypothetical protein
MNETLKKVKVMYNMAFVDIDNNLYNQQDCRYQTTVLRVEDTTPASVYVDTENLLAVAYAQDANDAVILDGIADINLNAVSPYLVVVLFLYVLSVQYLVSMDTLIIGDFCCVADRCCRQHCCGCCCCGCCCCGCCCCG